MTEPLFATKLPETDDGTILFSVPFPAELNAETLAALKAMAPIILKQPYAIDYIHSYGQDSPFFAGLANGRLLGSIAPATGYTYATPRGHDMATGQETDWVDLTRRPAAVHAFTVCYFGSEEFLPECPYVLALIEFAGADTLFLGRLLGLDPHAPTVDWIGMRVGLRFRRNSKFKPTDVYFYPLGAKEE
ncbi:MAG: nucleotide-binding protein [Chloroflexi bacterium HGW-Chloroflexi-1]|nr:MAG: nucleotide-binding protein [Chloroflexi bacterium HGW-Chloroflexi-1]